MNRNNDGPDWKRQLADLIAEQNWAHSSKPKGVSSRTMEARRKFFFRLFAELRSNGEKDCKIGPYQLRNKHVALMVARWVKCGLSPGTIQLYLSHVRTLGGWIGKPGLVLSPERYVNDPKLVRRNYAAQEDKSWSAKGLSAAEIIERVSRYDPFVGAQLGLCHAYGARAKEAIMCRPHAAEADGKLLLIMEWDCDAYLEVKRGTKGGRLRYVPIDTPEKRAALERAKQIAQHTNDSLGRPGKTLKQNMRRYRFVMEKFGVTKNDLGVTGHGLRHEYANDRYQQVTGQPSPVRGGQTVNREIDRRARLSVAKELGHSRENISSAYCGAITRKSPAGK